MLREASAHNGRVLRFVVRPGICYVDAFYATYMQSLA
jgi:hypothetical protein